MIKEFNNATARDSAVIYNSTMEQIKKLYAVNPQQAGELAISAMELALTGQFSSDDFMVDVILQDMKVVNAKSAAKYEKKVEASRQDKITKQQLDLIAELHLQGLKQKDIAARIGTTQQTICNRLSLIRAEFTELLEEKQNLQVLQEKQTKQDYDNENDNDNENVNDNYNKQASKYININKNSQNINQNIEIRLYFINEVTI